MHIFTLADAKAQLGRLIAMLEAGADVTRQRSSSC